ncbi:gliding motility-associated C-terminal domain-containing protein [Taibaiella soli]|nr:gliding motility-associated C-terminal domain-containing protein [Taibaiella soli]
MNYTKLLLLLFTLLTCQKALSQQGFASADEINSEGFFYYDTYKKAAPNRIVFATRTNISCGGILAGPVSHIIQGDTLLKTESQVYFLNPYTDILIIKNTDTSAVCSQVWTSIIDSDTYIRKEKACLSCSNTGPGFSSNMEAYKAKPYELILSAPKPYRLYGYSTMDIPNPQNCNSYTMFTAGLRSLFLQWFSSVGTMVSQPGYKNLNMRTQVPMFTPSVVFSNFFTQYYYSLGIESPGYGSPYPTDSIVWHPYTEQHIYRFNDYTNITSPEPTNAYAVRAQKNVPYTYNFGITDAEHDSTRLVAYRVYGSGRNWHPSLNTCDIYGVPSTTAEIKAGLRDSVSPITYLPGYSYNNPFGPGSNFSIDAVNGSFTFTAQDTGVYFVVFKLEEYRDGKLLGDVLVSRLAIVLDGAYHLVKIYPAEQLTGGYMGADSVIRLCPNDSCHFTVPVGGNGNSATQLYVTDNAGQTLPGSTVSYQYSGTDSARINIGWRAPANGSGSYNVLISAVDTNCTLNPNRISVFKNIRIQVPGNVGITGKDSILCKGQSTTLHAIGTGPYYWEALPGGDTAIACHTCDSITVAPSVSTSYVLYIPGANCVARDTFKLKVIPDYTVQLNSDSIFCLPIPTNYTLDAVANPPAGYYKYQWTGAQVSNPTIPNPVVRGTGASNTYYVTVTDSFKCFTHADSVTLRSYNLHPEVIPAQDTFCPGAKVQLNATGGQVYTWSPATGLSCVSCPDPVASPDTSIVYIVTITDTTSGCHFELASGLVHADFPDVDAGPDINATGGPFLLQGAAGGGAHVIWTPAEYLDFPDSISTIGRVPQSMTFMLTADNGHCRQTDSMHVFYTPCAEIHFPNAFTPNGDGVNDVFMFTNTEPLQVERMRIFDRWGQQVDLEYGAKATGWDGKYNGAPQPSGVYVYMIEIICNGVKIKKQGNVTLLR